MRITSVEAIGLRMPLGSVYAGSHYAITHRCAVVTRLCTDEGVVGECFNGDTHDAQGEVIALLRDEVGPLVVGRDAFNIEGCWEAMLAPADNIRSPRKLVRQAQACVDSAINDAVGKALNVPLGRLWGGYAQSVAVIGIGGYYADDKTLADYAAEVEALAALGLAGCKFKVGGLNPEADAERVRAVRRAVGPDFVIAVDANQGWRAADAIRFARLVADLDIRWFEEPCRWYDDRLAMARVRQATGMAIAAGQSEITLAGCRDLIAGGAVDVCNFDASEGGGPTEWRRVAALAHAFGVDMGHHEELQLSIHLLSAIPNATYGEVFHPDRDPLFYTLIANRSPFVGGRYSVPEGPGWGLVLDEDVIRKFRVD